MRQSSRDRCIYICTAEYIWVFPKLWYPQNHPMFNRVFHEINHPFWGVSPYFWFNIHIFYTYIEWHLMGDGCYFAKQNRKGFKEKHRRKTTESYPSEGPKCPVRSGRVESINSHDISIGDGKINFMNLLYVVRAKLP